MLGGGDERFSRAEFTSGGGDETRTALRDVVRYPRSDCLDTFLGLDRLVRDHVLEMMSWREATVEQGGKDGRSSTLRSHSRGYHSLRDRQRRTFDGDREARGPLAKSGTVKSRN